MWAGIGRDGNQTTNPGVHRQHIRLPYQLLHSHEADEDSCSVMNPSGVVNYSKVKRLGKINENLQHVLFSDWNHILQLMETPVHCRLKVEHTWDSNWECFLPWKWDLVSQMGSLSQSTRRKLKCKTVAFCVYHPCIICPFSWLPCLCCRPLHVK